MNTIVIGIIGCEIGFWVVLAIGLAARYLLKLRTLSSALLLCVPLLDVLLLCLIAWDLLANGKTADFTHGLGAIYLGFTIAFGHQIITRVDAWVSHRFAGGAAPKPVPKSGLVRLKYEWGQWLRMLLCAVITTAVLGGILILIGDPARTDELAAWIARVWLVTGVWFVGWPVWYSAGYLFNTKEAA
jgi:hypothetical protein